MSARARRCLMFAALAAVCVSCSSAPDNAGTPGGQIKALESSGVPSEILGLAVTAEGSAEFLERLGTTYVSANALYSMREGELVQATLQVTEIDDPALAGSAEFRETVVGRIGSSTPERFRVGDIGVWLTTGTQQTLALWFKERHFFVLNVRDDFARPRSLVRAATAVQP